jgi:hypothetical protein
MAVGGSVDLLPITHADVSAVGDFLQRNLNQRVPASAWEAALLPPWAAQSPNHGFMLRSGNEIVGAYLAFYSERVVEGQVLKICNLAAWCVSEDYRSQGLRLSRALLGQRGYEFTDLSPSGNVVALNRRLKFRDLDTATELVANLPWPIWSRRTRIVSDPERIEALLSGRDLQIYRDHKRSAAARHLVAVRDDKPCYVMFRRDRRKNLPLFASFLYVSDPDVFRSSARMIERHLLLRHRVLATLAERRLVGSSSRPSIALRSPRSKMFRSDALEPDQVDYLYSELAWVAW